MICSLARRCLLYPKIVYKFQILYFDEKSLSIAAKINGQRRPDRCYADISSPLVLLALYLREEKRRKRSNEKQ
jgi:hypothetical protein